MATNLTKDNPLKLILVMSLPIMLGNLFQQMYSTVDAIIVGRYLGSGALAAVGSTAGVYSMIIWFVCGLSGGYAVILAQHFGAGEDDLLRSGVCIDIELSVGVTGIVTIVSLVFIDKLMSLMRLPEEIYGDTLTYLYVIIAGMMATMFYNLCASVLRAIGDSKTPFVFIIVSSVLNIVLDILFIRAFAMGVFGAALATVISQAVSGVLCAIHIYVKFDLFKFQSGDWRFDWTRAKKMLSYGIPSGLCGVTTAIGIMILQVAINTYGTTIIAGYTAAIKIQNFIEVPFNALCMTMINYEGQNLGAGRLDRMHKGFVQCMMVAFGLAIASSILVMGWGRQLSSIFVDASATSAIEVIDFATKYIWYTGLFFIPFSILLIARSTLQGMGFRSAPVMIGITESVLRIVATIYLIRNHSELILCFVSPVIWTSVAIMLVFMYVYWIKHLKKVLA